MAGTVLPQHSGSAPTGRVTISESGTRLCTITLASGKRTCTLSSKELKAGTHHLVATYGGRTNFKSSTSAKETFTVAKRCAGRLPPSSFGPTWANLGIAPFRRTD